MSPLPRSAPGQPTPSTVHHNAKRNSAQLGFHGHHSIFFHGVQPQLASSSSSATTTPCTPPQPGSTIPTHPPGHHSVRHRVQPGAACTGLLHGCSDGTAPARLADGGLQRADPPLDGGLQQQGRSAVDGPTYRACGGWLTFRACPCVWHCAPSSDPAAVRRCSSCAGAHAPLWRVAASYWERALLACACMHVPISCMHKCTRAPAARDPPRRRARPPPRPPPTPRGQHRSHPQHAEPVRVMVLR